MLAVQDIQVKLQKMGLEGSLDGILLFDDQTKTLLRNLIAEVSMCPKIQHESHLPKTFMCNATICTQLAMCVFLGMPC